MSIQLTPRNIVNFWKKVERRSADECWEWLAHRDRDGYGKFGVNYSNYTAHRISFLIAFGRLTDGLLVCHSCDNPSCVNPAHLWEGTGKDNIDDMFAKGRQNKATGNRHGSQTHPESRPRGDGHGLRLHPEALRRGEDNPGSKLTERDVMVLRLEYSRGAIGFKAIGRKFGIGAMTARAAILGITWKHVKFPTIKWELRK